MPPLTLKGPGVLKGTLSPPGDKSISHRAIMFGALSQGQSIYDNFLESEDCLHTLKAFQTLGIPIEHKPGTGHVVIQGQGLQGLKAPAGELYLGNSGTTMRLLLGVLAGQRFEVTLTGDDSLSSRPMRRVTHPLKQMGAQIKGREQGNFAPMTIRGGKLKGIDFENKWGSAQVKSCLLLASLYAEGKTRSHEWIPSRDHTERFLQACGVKVSLEDSWLSLEKPESLKPLEARIPGDISAAAFFIVGAALCPGSEVTIENVGLNPTRTGLLEVLKRMGAVIEINKCGDIPEPYGSIYVKGSKLKGTRIAKAEIPSLIDELPILMAAMALAEGESLVSGAEELRVKETDRIHSMVTNLNAVGGDAQELPDGCLIRGVKRFKGGSIQSFGDHRTAMSFAIASLASEGDMIIDDTSSVATSYPHFFNDFKTLRE